MLIQCCCCYFCYCHFTFRFSNIIYRYHLDWFAYILVKRKNKISMKEVDDIGPSTSTSCEVNSMAKNAVNKRKRRASNTSENDVQIKRFIPLQENDDTFHLLDFTDEVLLEVLQNCDCITLYALSKWVYQRRLSWISIMSSICMWLNYSKNVLVFFFIQF